MLKNIKTYGTHILIVYIVVVLLLHVVPLGGKISSLDKVEVLEIRLDYLLHALMFMPWAIIIWYMFGISFRQDPVKAVIWFIAGIIFAAGAEYIQNYLSYRAYNINDVAGNVAGIIIGSIVFFWKKPRTIIDLKSKL